MHIVPNCGEGSGKAISVRYRETPQPWIYTVHNAQMHETQSRRAGTNSYTATEILICGHVCRSCVEHSRPIPS